MAQGKYETKVFKKIVRHVEKNYGSFVEQLKDEFDRRYPPKAEYFAERIAKGRGISCGMRMW